MAQSRMTGRLVRQLEGYSAFIPEPLPPNPPIEIDFEMQSLLSKADRALGRLDGSIQTLPNPDLFVLMYVRKEAVLSSQIEGTQSSINDVLEVEANILSRHRPDDVGEVLNYIGAMNTGLRRLNEIPVSLRLIKEMHGRLMRGVRGGASRPGEFRTTQNWIGAPGATIETASFVPPPPSVLLDKLGDWEAFIHQSDDLPPLLKIGIAHAHFETIHPFLDGNGRIGRLLITFLLCEQEILIRPVLYLSYFFKQYRNEYYNLLQRTRTNGDLEAWLKFFLMGIATVSNEATETARKIVAMKEIHERTVREEFGRAVGNGLAILDFLFEKPYFSISDISKRLDISFQAANNLVHRLAHYQIINETTGQVRNRVFHYAPYIRLFSDRSNEES